MMLKKIPLIAFNIILLEVLLFLLSFAFDPDADLKKSLNVTSIIYAKKIPHPYLGFVSDSFRPLDMDKIPQRDNKFILTIAGGSVAEKLCERSQHTQLLQKLIAEKTKKEVLLNCLAVGSFMQPQQLIAAMLYARDTDFFFSLEGANELFDDKDPEHPDYPQSRFKKLFFSDFRDNFMQRNWLYLLSISEIWSYQQHRWWDKFYTVKFGKSVARRILTRFIKNMALTKPTPLEVRIQIWQENLNELNVLLRARQTPYLVMFQPHIYDKTQLTPAETILTKDWTDQEFTNEYIAEGRKMIQQVGREGLHVVDYSIRTDFLNKELEFTDDCHLTDPANDNLSRAIAREVLEALTQQKGPSAARTVRKNQERSAQTTPNDSGHGQ